VIGQAGAVEEAQARFLLNADDTAIVQAAARQLVRERTVDAMSFMCEVIASNDDDEIGEEILWVLSEAWQSGEVPEVPQLIEAVVRVYDGDAQRKAREVRDWLGLSDP
jgi:hypothetical protein